MKTFTQGALVVVLNVMLCYPVLGQVYATKTGKMHFFSETPIENIEATSAKAEGALQVATGQVSARILVNTFQFDKKLMQQHFNENYLETDKYPYATLEGKLKEPIPKQGNGAAMYTLPVKLTMHGVAKDYTVPCQIDLKDGVPTRAKGKFKVKLADHNIDIPTIVIKQIAEVIDVDFDFALLPK